MQFKVNLHTHTTFSDGKNTPKEMVEAYKELGYGAVAITDHDVFTPPPDVEGITVLQGCEHTTENGKQIEHWLEIRGEEEPPLKIKAHPNRYGDTCLELQLGVQQGSYELIESTEHGTLYEYYTTCGIPYIYSDDAHSVDMVGKAWILVDAPSTSPDDIIRAIRAGNFVPGGSPPEGTPHPIPYMLELASTFMAFVTTSWAIKSMGRELKEAVKEFGKAAKGSIKESAIKLIERL